MVKSSAETPDAYIAGLPVERREAISTVRKVVLDNLPEGYEEGMQHGMICYYVPLERYQGTHNKQPLSIATLGSQKNHMALHLMGVYSDPETEQWFNESCRERQEARHGQVLREVKRDIVESCGSKIP